MTKRRSHVEGSTNLTFEQHVIAAQMNLGRLARSLQLLQMTVAQFAFFVALVADSLGIRDALRHRWRRAYRVSFRR